jgi:hypothetical protein
VCLIFKQNYRIFGFQSDGIMQFNSILVLLLFIIIFVQTLHGQTCDCRICPDSTTVPANSERQLFNSPPCPAGSAAAVSSINVQSTDGSGFQISTMDDPSDTTHYTAGSTNSLVTCFKMGSGSNVGGQKSRIYVVMRCRNGLKPCSLRYSIRLICRSVAATSTSKSTPAPTAKTITTGGQTTTSLLPLATPNWVGVFNIAHRCDTRTCCCPSKQATLSRTTNNYLQVKCQFVGQCPSSSYLDDSIPMPNSFETQIVFLGNPILIKLSQDSSTIELKNPLFPKCSETARRNGAMSTSVINLLLIALLSSLISLKQFLM